VQTGRAIGKRARLLPIFLQAVLGFGPIKAGLVLTPLAGVVIFAAPLSGWLSDRMGSRWLVFGGMVMSSAPEEKAGQGSGVLSTMRQMGAVLGIAVMGAVLQNRAVAYVRAQPRKVCSQPLILPAVIRVL